MRGSNFYIRHPFQDVLNSYWEDQPCTVCRKTTIPSYLTQKSELC